MPPLSVVVLLALATFRVTRLITTDTILNAPRDALYAFAWDDDRPVERDGQWYPTAKAAWRARLFELVTCDWCMGVWVGIVVYCAWRWGGDVALAIITVAAICGAQGALAQFVVTAHEETKS